MREGWISDKLSNCIKLKSGDGLTAKKMIPGDFPVYGGNGIAGYHSSSNLDGENIIIGRVGALCGIARYIDEQIWLTDNAFKISESKYEYDFEFLTYLLNFVDLRSYARQAAQPVISNSSLKDVVLSFPKSISEQKQIVSILDKAFAAIDQAKANIERNIENAKELFQNKLNEIFSQKGEGWEEKRLQDIALEFGRGKSKHRPRNDKKLYGGEYPFVQTGDIRNSDKIVKEYKQSYNEVGLAQSKLWPKGTICITIAANIAETAIINFDACFPDSIIGVVVDSKKANLDYTYYALQFLKSELQAKGKGSAQDNINMGTFQNQYFPFPDINTQKNIVNELDSLKLNTNSLIEKYAKKSMVLEELKKSILQKAFAGELTVNDADKVISYNSENIAAESQVKY